MICNKCGNSMRLLFTSWYCDCEAKGFLDVSTIKTETHTCDFKQGFTCTICGQDIASFWGQLGSTI